MARKKLVEHNALVQAIEFGLPQAEIMEKFGLDSPSALKQAYLDGLVALNKITGIKNGRKPKKVDNRVRINGRGSLVIPKKLVKNLELNESDEFQVEKNRTGLTLKRVKKAPKTILRKKTARHFEEKGETSFRPMDR